MAKNKNIKRGRSKESGNAFLFILLGVVLFASLSFVMSRGFGTEGTSKISDRRAELATSDILTFSRKMEAAVNRLRQNNCSESDLNFDNNIVADYGNPGAPDDGSCDVFGSTGAKASYQAPQVDWNNPAYAASAFYNEWAFIGTSSVYDLGLEKGSCNASSNPDSCVDLMMLLPYVKKDLCLKINDKLGITNTNGEAPRDTGLSAVKFIGDYDFSRELGDEGGTSDFLREQSTGCYSVDRGAGEIVHHFYYVLLSR